MYGVCFMLTVTIVIILVVTITITITIIIIIIINNAFLWSYYGQMLIERTGGKMFGK